MGVIQDDATIRTHLEAAAKLGGRTPGSAEAIRRLNEEPEMPALLAHLWGWYVQLSAGRSSGMMGSTHISYQDVEAWARLMDHSPLPHEVEALMMMDTEFRSAQHAQQPRGGK